MQTLIFRHQPLETDVSSISNVTKPGEGVEGDKPRVGEIPEPCPGDEETANKPCPMADTKSSVQTCPIRWRGLLTLNRHYCLHKFYINYILDHHITPVSSQ